jgi:2-keto-4-pentenoate hydratase/2-oxohepta-3-ene-1,7-dioic acid hydratase in catechol pathway
MESKMKSIKFNNRPVFPSKIICVGRNYVEHITELGNEVPSQMVLFNKPNSAISPKLHYISPDTRFEGELCFLIQDNAIAGIGFGLDLTQANIQNELKSKRLPWERAKAFDASAVLSDFVAFDCDITQIRFDLYINRKLIQWGSYDLMIYKPDEILKEIQSYMSLEDGDIIMSGTPKGVANYQKGDIFVAKVYCANKVILEKCWVVN